MAITREAAQAAVEQYLPRTVNFAQSSDLGERDRAAVFQRLLQIVLTALLLDQDAIFYIVYLAAQRVLARVNSAVGYLETLQGDEYLKAITGLDPTRIDDLTKLSAAKADLVSLSGGLVSGQFGTVYFDNFKSNIVGFLEDQVKPNVVGGNRAVTNASVTALMATLESAWDSVLERRGTLFTILPNYQAEDLRTLVSTTIIRALEQKISDLESTLLTLTTSEQSQQAEQILIDMAAGEAALRIVGDAASPVGTIVVGPAADGYTEANYLEITGKAKVEPLVPLLSGTAGAASMDVVYIGFDGSAVDDLDGDPLTPRFNDPVAAGDWTTTPVLAGYYLTFVEEGRTYAIDGVDPGYLSLRPEVQLTRTGGDRWAVTQSAPGRFFQDPDVDFWVESTGIGPGETESTIVGSGVAGSLLRTNLEQGTDGTNVVSTGTTGVARPRVSAGGTDGEATSTPSVFQATSATFLTDGVASLNDPKLVIRDNTNGNQAIYDIVGVLSQTQVLISGTFPSAPTTGEVWHTEEGSPSAQLTFDDPNATFLSDGVEFPDFVKILSGKYTGAVPRANSLSGQTRIYLDVSILNNPNVENGYDSPVTYRVQRDVNYFDSPSAQFVTNGVQAGDWLEISGTASDDGLWEIFTVLSETRLELNDSLSGDELTGVTYSVYRYADHGDTFYQSDAVDFVALDVSGMMEVVEYVAGVPQAVLRQGYLDVAGERYSISRRDPDSPSDTLRIAAVAAGRGDVVGAFTFEDVNADFLAVGVEPTGYKLRITVGTNAGKAFTITGVAVTQLTLASSATVAADETYEVWPLVQGPSAWAVRAGDKTRVFRDNSGPFGTPVNPTYPNGSTLVINPQAPDEFRVTIDSTVSSTELRVLQDMDEGLTGLDYAVVPVVREGQTLWTVNRRFEVVQVVSKNSLEVTPELPNSYPVGVDWYLLPPGADPLSRRISDKDGALLYAPGGFGSSLVGARIDLMVQQPVRTTIAGVADSDGDLVNEALDVPVFLPLGNRRVAYRVLVLGEGTTDEFFSASTDLSAVLVGDVLTVWSQAQAFTVSSLAALPVPHPMVSPLIEARLMDQSFVAVRDGSEYHGRYLLLEFLNNLLVLDSDTEQLRLTVAEALLDFGQVVFSTVSSGADGGIPDDGDDDGVSTTFTAPTGLFITSGARYGDRLTVIVNPTPLDVRVVYVTEVVSESTLLVSPELPETVGPLDWELDRNSVSNSLFEAERLRQQMLALQELLEAYTIPTNRTMSKVLEMLLTQGMDRAVDLLYDGNIADFVNMVDTDASYASSARAAVQTAASSVADAPSVGANRAGIDPSTGAPAGGSGSLATTSASTSLPEGSVAAIQMAKGVAMLASDEYLQSVTKSSLEEVRNRAIYELTGEVESGVITDSDPTLPWLAQTGALEARLIARRDELIAALQYMLDNPDEFVEAEGE